MSTRAKAYRSPPRNAIEAFEMLPYRTLAEVIDDVIYISDFPSLQHQEILGNIVTSMYFKVKNNKLGKFVAGPVDVYFDSKNVVQPDILFIANENMGIVEDGKVKGAPDLIIEILSPGNKKHDTELKKPVYETYGVKELVIVDPNTKEVFSYYLPGKKYVQQQSSNGKIKSRLLKKTFSF